MAAFNSAGATAAVMRRFTKASGLRKASCSSSMLSMSSNAGQRSSHVKGAGSLTFFKRGLRRANKNLNAIGPSVSAESRTRFSKKASGLLIACSSSSFESKSLDARLTWPHEVSLSSTFTFLRYLASTGLSSCSSSSVVTPRLTVVIVL